MRTMTERDRDNERWLDDLTLENVRTLFRNHGVEQLFCKVLQQNNNSKQQIYVGSDLAEVGWIPSGETEVVASASQKLAKDDGGPIFRVFVPLFWITQGGSLARAPAAKLIAYPQYPEVRFSGFLLGCKDAPSFLLDRDRRGCEPGRLLLLAPTRDGKLLGLVLPPESRAAREILELRPAQTGVFLDIPLRAGEKTGLQLLLVELCRIHRLGWTDSVSLGPTGNFVPCNSTNCGGYTLEAHLGIRPNGVSEPDFRGWEVKARTVRDFDKPEATRITLMTPEPDGGVYSLEGPKTFIRRWGYPDKSAKADRLNFGGIYKCGRDFHADTRIRMVLDGYDAENGAIDANGAIRLIDDRDVEAASWSFRKLMDHWKRKHAQAAYVPCQNRIVPARAYRYGGSILLGEGTEFRHFLKAVAVGAVYYDPGIKLEGASTAKPKQKLRSQIRVNSSDLKTLYRSLRPVEVCES